MLISALRRAWPRRRARLETAIREYLEVSRSPLRLSEPAQHAAAEQAAWDRVRRAAGIGGTARRPRREEIRC